MFPVNRAPPSDCPDEPSNSMVLFGNAAITGFKFPLVVLSSSLFPSACLPLMLRLRTLALLFTGFADDAVIVFPSGATCVCSPWSCTWVMSVRCVPLGKFSRWPFTTLLASRFGTTILKSFRRLFLPNWLFFSDGCCVVKVAFILLRVELRLKLIPCWIAIEIGWFPVEFALPAPPLPTPPLVVVHIPGKLVKLEFGLAAVELVLPVLPELRFRFSVLLLLLGVLPLALGLAASEECTGGLLDNGMSLGLIVLFTLDFALTAADRLTGLPLLQDKLTLAAAAVSEWLLSTYVNSYGSWLSVKECEFLGSFDSTQSFL